MNDLDCDVVVVGSGAGGAPVAWRLAEAGCRVVVLEKGPRHAQADFVHDEIAIVRRDFFVPSVDDDPHVLVRAGSSRGERSSFGWVARCVGGGTVHMAGYFYRLHPIDFRMASTYGRSDAIPLADWPILYDDLEPYYARIERAIGVSGDDRANRHAPPRSTPYPLGPVRAHPASAWIDRACARLGYDAFPSPRAVLSEAYRGRSPCNYCDFCGSYGCETGAKSSTLATLLPAAEATGRCTIVPGAFVARVELGPDGRASGCLYHDEEGNLRRVRARVVCLACSAVETARLLLLSADGGLANSSGLVGRNLLFSTFTTGSGLWRLDRAPDERRVLEDRHPFLGRSVQDFYRVGDGGATGGIDKGGTLRFGFPHANPIFTALRLAHAGGGLEWGASLKRRMLEYWRETRTIEFETFADFLPNPGTRVELDPEVRDRWGLPAARIHLDVPPHHAVAGRFLQTRGLEILEAAGADRVEPGEVGGTTGHLVHGTCRAGHDPATSVVDAGGRTHDVDNLYVSDASYFPTAGGVPPTLTILANALRIADGIADRVRRGELR